MKKGILFIVLFFLLGCSNKQPQQITTPKHLNKNARLIEEFIKGDKIKHPTKKIAVYNDKVMDTKEAQKILLKTNPLFAKKYKKEALKINMRLTPNAPLYRPPLFAKMIVYPYVSDNGIYHDTQIVWIKIKKGEFVLNQKPNKRPKVFGINGGSYE